MTRITRIPLFAVLSFGLAVTLTAASGFAESRATSQVPPRVSGPVDETNRVVLHGNVHPLAQARFDKGAVEDSFPAERLFLLLRRSSAQEAALDDFLRALHTPGDPNFHKWLKPDEFGRLYGPADSDIAAVSAWLQSHGFTVNQVHPGKMAIEFSGTAGQVRDAFHTEIHHFEINGEAHVANSSDPEIPAALSPVVLGLAPMNDFRAQSYLKVLGRATFDPKTHVTKPDWTYPDGGGSWNLAVAPGDFAVQYDINPVYKNGINGAGETIGIVSASNVDLSLVQAYQKLFGLPANLPEVVVDGVDPGENGAATEAYLDIEVSGSVAPGAKVVMYTSWGTALTDGLAVAAYRAVGDDIAGTISTSYGNCEPGLGAGGNSFWNSIWQQAATQGQTAFVSAGDGGSAGCDDFDTQSVATGGLAVNGIGSTPYNVSVGGTDFYYSDVNTSQSSMYGQIATYWSGTTGSTIGTTSPKVSLLKYAPEQVWNNMFGYNASENISPPNPADAQYGENIVSGSGGASSAALYPASGPATGYPKPTWQTGTGVPNDNVRDLPDVSLYASNDANWSFYPICASPGDCTNINTAANGGAAWISGVGGTSASSPSMAGIQALVNQAMKSWQGQADYFYYPIAKLWPDAFHDITVGGNEVPCVAKSPNCVAGAAGSITAGYDVESGYAATAGYDLASGLGSLDVANLIHWWPDVTMKPTTTTLAISPTTFVHGKQTTITSTVAPKSGTGTPTGSISIANNDGLMAYTGLDYLTLGSTGKVDYPIDNLPGGTYQVTARYGGDGTFAPSTSAPVTVTVTPENNTLEVSGYVLNPFDQYLYNLTPGIEIPYGAQIFLDAQPTSVNGNETNFGTPATGTVAYTDNTGTATFTSTQPLNNFGMAEWNTGIFAPGSHTVSEAYSGDPSYHSSSVAKAASFTVIKGDTVLEVYPLVYSVSAGATVDVDVELYTLYPKPLGYGISFFGTPPTGSVTVTLGGQSITLPLKPLGDTENIYLEAVATFTNVPAGILQATASYAGDANWLASTGHGPTVLSLSGRLTPTVKLTTNSTNPGLGQLVTLSATVTGVSGKPVPTGTVTFLSDDQYLYYTENVVNGVATVTIPGYYGEPGNNIVTAIYNGDKNYNSGDSNVIDVTVNYGDFSLTTLAADVKVAAGKTGSSTLVYAPSDGFDSVLKLAASAPTGITVTPAPLPSALSGLTNDAVTIAVAGTVKPGVYPAVITASGGGRIHTAQILVFVP
jgi:hypothetical protein